MNVARCGDSRMQDHELYRRILGIESPWRVEWVELKLEAGEVHVYLGQGEVREWACPEWSRSCRQYDHQPERQWRHLDTCQYQTILHASPPRCECGEHGVRVVKLPWAEPSSRFTVLFAALAIAWLKASSQRAVAELLRLSWDEIHGITERPARKPFRWWQSWALRSRLQPMIQVARMLRRRFENIITYLRHRITHAASESINAKIRWVKYTARGFRDKQNFIHAIYFYFFYFQCGGLDLAPLSTK